MGSLLKTSVVVGFLLLLPALVYCERFVNIDLFMDKNCTYGPPILGFPSPYTFNATGNLPNYTFSVNPFNISQTIESAILKNVTAEVTSLIACQAGLECNVTGAFQISFNLSDVGACSTAGPPGTQFDKFVLT